jgi:hypothetical protein
MIVPVRRREMESFLPEIRNIESEPHLHQAYDKWLQSRINNVNNPVTAADGKRVIQGHYIRGEGPLGERAPEHQTQLDLKPFVEIDAPLPTRADRTEIQEGSSQTGLIARIWKRLFSQQRSPDNKRGSSPT